MIDRRKFIRQSIAGSLIASSGAFPWSAFEDEPNLTRLTILHTNDVHSRIDPFPMDGGRYQGLGGAAKRAKLVKKLRAENANVLLLDSGDIFQGTPYFNMFGGELEFKLMSEMAYDCATMGNHDFDSGIDGFSNQLKHAQFPFVVSNYNFRDRQLDNTIDKYKVFEKGDVKIGVIGLGIELDGLVPPALYGDTLYLDPITEAQKQADILKNDLKCDYIICLSHLGYDYRRSSKPQRICDTILAQNTRHIDLILGGHTHTFLDLPDKRRNLDGKEVLVNQAGWGGILLGKIDLVFEKNKVNKCVSCQNRIVK